MIIGIDTTKGLSGYWGCRQVGEGFLNSMAGVSEALKGSKTLSKALKASEKLGK